VQNGALVRTPSTRVALTVTRDRTIRFETYRYAGSAMDGDAAIPIARVDEWPPDGGATFLTPAFGVPPATANVRIVELDPLGALATAPNGRFRVAAIDDDGTAPTHPLYALALRASAQAAGTDPQIGDILTVRVDTDPSLEEVATAVGGGPALLSDGLPVDDPLSPGYAERARRIPAAAAALLPDGKLVLLVVDGRRPQISIGLNRAELIALVRSLGATGAMQFDSGGSATLVARTLGDPSASVQNDPSDGKERPVADGLFIYSDAPPGPPARLVVRPSAILALPGGTVQLHSAIVDTAGHALGPARGPWRIVAGAGASIDAFDVLHLTGAPREQTLMLEREGERATVPLSVAAGVARIVITQDDPNPDPHATIALHAAAFDTRGRTVGLGDQLTWSALRGSVDSNGHFTTSDVDGFVTASVGATKSSTIVRVGRHLEALAAFDDAHRALWHFSSTPASRPGMLALDASGFALSYDFSDDERAAYANVGLDIGAASGLACTLQSDGNGATARIAIVDRYGERSAFTLAKLTQHGTQLSEVRFPPSLAPPLTLQSIYVVGSLGSPLHAFGTLGVHDCRLIVPGTPPRMP
jgi:hypothetical protein